MTGMVCVGRGETAGPVGRYGVTMPRFVCMFDDAGVGHMRSDMRAQLIHAHHHAFPASDLAALGSLK